MCPNISIVIPCFNVEGYLDEFRSCMQSVLSQTMREIEIIAVDNGSTDRTGELLAEYAHKDARLRIVTLPHNTGHAGGRNHGILQARGKYLFFADADDELYPELCEKTYRCAEEQDADIVIFYPDVSEWGWDCSPAFPVTDSGVLETSRQKFESLHYFPGQWNKLIRTDLIRANEIRFPNHYYDDLCFITTVTVFSRKIVTLREVLYKWRNRKNSTTNTSLEKQLDIFKSLDLIVELLEKKDDGASWQESFLVLKWKKLHETHLLIERKEVDGPKQLQERFLREARKRVRQEDFRFLYHTGVTHFQQDFYAWFDVNFRPYFSRDVYQTVTAQERAVNSPKVSFIVPVYKVEPEFLRICLSSIAAQTMKNIEILCVNNASPDGSAAILEEFAAADPRFRVITLEANQKSSGGRNAAYPYLRGEFVQFVDADDIVEPDLCEKAVHAAETTGADVVLFDYYNYHNLASPGGAAKADEKCFDGNSPEMYQLFTAYTLVWDRLWRTDYLFENNLLFPQGAYCEDVRFVWDCMMAGTRVTRIPHVLYTWRNRPTSTTRSDPQTFLHVFPVFAQICSRLKENGCYEKYKEAFFYSIGTLSTLLDHFETQFPEDRPRMVETYRVVIDKDFYDYFTDFSSLLNRKLPWTFQRVREIVSQIDPEFNRILGDAPAACETPVGSPHPPRIWRVKIKNIVKRLLRPFRPVVERLANLVFGKHVQRIDEHGRRIGAMNERLTAMSETAAHMKIDGKKFHDLIKETRNRLQAETMEDMKSAESGSSVSAEVLAFPKKKTA